MMEIRIDYEKCISCGKCVEVCTVGAIELFEDTVVVADSDRCLSCMKCEMVCPVGAIHVEGKVCRMH